MISNILIFYILIFFLFQLSKSSDILKINEKKFTKIEAAKNYSIYSLEENKYNNDNTYLNVQFFLCEKTKETAHFSIYNEKIILFESDIVSSRQLAIPTKGLSNLKLNITSKRVYFNYQYTNTSTKFFSLATVYNLEKNSSEYTLNMTPIIANTSSKYELYSLKKNLTNQCEILEYTNNNKPFYSVTSHENKTILIFKFTYKEKLDKYILVKGIGINNFTYIHLYNIVSLKSSNLLLIVVICVVVVVLIFIVLIIYLVFCKEKKENTDFTISGVEEPLVS